MFFLYNSFNFHLNVDEREHLYASYMVFNGYVPYRDFFEHHHPLLWYLFAPFLIWFKNSPEIWYVMRGFGVGVNIGILYFIYKICVFLGLKKKEAFGGCLLYLGFEAIWNGGIEFRPDNLSVLFEVGGVYYFFEYVKKRDFGKLIVSYMLFLLSFLVMQKMIFSLIVMGAIILFLPRENKNIKKEMLCFLIPLECFVAYLFYLYYAGALKDYFELNWLLNWELSFYGWLYERFVFIIPIVMCLIGAVKFRKANYFVRVIILMLWGQVGCALLRAPFIHYLVPVYPFLVILLVDMCKKVFDKKLFEVLWVFLLGEVFCMVYLLNLYIGVPLSAYVRLSRIELEATNEDDEIIPGEVWTGGLRKNALGYYWFGWSIAKLDYKLFKRREFPDLNRIIEIKKPKIIANNDAIMYSCLSEDNVQNLNKCSPLQTVDLRVLGDDYISSDFIHLKVY